MARRPARGSLLQVDRLSPDGVSPPPSRSAHAAEERRLFYVACSRAQSPPGRHRGGVGLGRGRAAVPVRRRADADVSGEAGARSRAGAGPTGRCRCAAPWPSCVASARTPTIRPSATRAAALLARLAGHPAGAAAHPDRWWGLAERTHADEPVRDPDEPLGLSGSQMNTLTHCACSGSSATRPRASAARRPPKDSARSSMPSRPRSSAPALSPTRTNWQCTSTRCGPSSGSDPVGERARARRGGRGARAVRRGTASNKREVLAAEHEFDVIAEVDGRAVRLRGSMDRVERGADGVHVVDFKTSKKPISSSRRPRSILSSGSTRWRSRRGRRRGHAPGAPPAGAELVYLRQGDDHPKVRAQAVAPARASRVEQLGEAVRAIGDEDFAATVGDACGYCAFQRICPAQEAGALGRHGGARMSRLLRARRTAPARPARHRVHRRSRWRPSPPASTSRSRSSRAPARARRRSWRLASFGWWATKASRPSASSASRSPTRPPPSSASGCGRASPGSADAAQMEWGDPTTSTYHAFAGALISEHGLRLGLRAGPRVVTDASRFQRFARAVEAFDGRHPPPHHAHSVARARVPRLDAELSEHCVSTDELRAFDERVIAIRRVGGLAEKIWRRRGHGAQAHRDHPSGRRLPRQRRPPTASWTSPTRWRGAPRWPSCPRSAKPCASGSTSCCSTSTRTRRSPSAICCVGLFHGHAGHGRRRPGARHLRLAWGRHRQPRGVPRRLSRSRAAAAADECARRAAARRRSSTPPTRS